MIINQEVQCFKLKLNYRHKENSFVFPISHVDLIFNVLKNSLLQVQEGVDAFLFQLLVLGCLGHSSGYVWRKSEMDYYITESMPLLTRNTDTQVSTGL